MFKNIVEEYIRTAQPVGSKLVVDKFNLDISPATVRNDMRELEEQDLIISPHTSAGRIPTEDGYKYFVENYINLDDELNQVERNKILEYVGTLRGMSDVDDIKILAKIISEKSGLLVFVAFDKNNFYYTGLSNLFSQPEFQNLNLIYNISEVVDHLDEVISKIYDTINSEDKVIIKIGKDNLFSADCSVIMIKIKNNLIGIVGPTRMNYQNNVKLINFVKNVL